MNTVEINAEEAERIIDKSDVGTVLRDANNVLQDAMSRDFEDSRLRRDRDIGKIVSRPPQTETFKTKTNTL
jgi:hypothetical protein